MELAIECILPPALSSRYLDSNLLSGGLPDSWSNLTMLSELCVLCACI
jgi:hypothetical protein